MNRETALDVPRRGFLGLIAGVFGLAVGGVAAARAGVTIDIPQPPSRSRGMRLHRDVPITYETGLEQIERDRTIPELMEAGVRQAQMHAAWLEVTEGEARAIRRYLEARECYQTRTIFPGLAHHELDADGVALAVESLADLQREIARVQDFVRRVRDEAGRDAALPLDVGSLDDQGNDITKPAPLMIYGIPVRVV